MAENINVVGVGMTPFKTPKQSESYVAMGAAAIRDALADAGIAFDTIEQAYASYVYGDSCCGHRVVYEAGLTGIPIFNVNSNCSSGSSGLFLARQALLSGQAECVLAVGFEQMTPGALSEHWTDRPTPLEKFIDVANEVLGDEEGPMAPKLFGAAGREYFARYGMRPDTLAKIPVKARRHAEHNPRAVFTEQLTVEGGYGKPADLRPPDPLSVLPTHVWCRRRDPVYGRFCRTARPQPRGAHPRPVARDGHEQQLRRQRDRRDRRRYGAQGFS